MHPQTTMELYAEGMERCGTPEKALEYLIPVSYTHLDVYKRQPLRNHAPEGRDQYEKQDG